VRPAIPETAETPATSARHLVVSLAGRCLAVPVDRLRELSAPLPLAFLPLVPPWFRGLANLRGNVLPVLDLLPFLGEGELPDRPSNRLLVLGPAAGGVTAGLLAERVHGVAAPEPGAVRGAAAGEESPLAPYLAGRFEHAGAEASVLDVDRLLAAMAVS
jgi:chemotaxis signal transduction protein